MKTVKPVEQATDSQLRQLTRRFESVSEYSGIIQSQLPLVTTERAQLVNLLKANHIFQFAIQ
jgi:hypothetical protein